ncbi:MAG: DUF1735 domain-containing protein [Alistipes sp.]
MKQYVKYLTILVAGFIAFAACANYDANDHKFDNKVYLSVSKTSEVQLTTFSNNRPDLERPLQIALAYPEGADVNVSLEVDPSLVATYNARYRTQWPMLDAKYYELSAKNVTIPAGKTTQDITLHLRELMGEGEAQTGALPMNETYLLPVRITNASLAVLGGSSIAYYVVKRSSAITVAAQLTDNWLEFPTLDKWGPGSEKWNQLRAFTYEALIYLDDFATKDVQGNPVNISTVMGIEDYALMRIGDTNFEREQIQFDGSGVGVGKFPGRDPAKILQKGRWYHVATTYDQQTRIARVYVDGKIQSEGTELGSTTLNDKNFIHLARRALYDLWNNESDPDMKAKYKEWGYDTMIEARQFFISYSYNDFRPLNGKIAEARVWSVARTPEQIWDNMYNIENPKDDATLLGYWKFNEGKGNEITDYSQYGITGKAKFDIVWPDGIEIPEINKTEE